MVPGTALLTETSTMNDLLANIIDTHGNMDSWNGSEKVDATIVSGGGFFPLKGVLQDSDSRRMTVWLHEERSPLLPYGAPDQRTVPILFQGS